MKNINCKKNLYLILNFMIMVFLSGNMLFAQDTGLNELPDSLKVHRFAGTIVNSENGTPVVFANIFINETNLGTVSNSDGEFIIKVPENHMDKSLGISSLGYRTRFISFRSLASSNNEIELEPFRYVLEEVEIHNLKPREMIAEALDKIPDNYGTSPVMMTAFYREAIKKGWSYVGVAEAVFDVFKDSYDRPFDYDYDRMKMFKGRKSQDVRRMDTLLFKLQGGPYYLFQLDLARHPRGILLPDAFDYYEYDLEGVVNFNGRSAYVIAFEQKEDVELPLFDGKIYIDTETYAFSGVEFALSPYGIEYADEVMIKKKPFGTRIDVNDAVYRVTYRKIDDRWYFNYARTEAEYRVRWRRKLFSSNYTIVAEIAITDIDQENIVKFRSRESVRAGDILSEKVEKFVDPDFWGDYNIIQPEQPIERTIERLGRQLQRRVEDEGGE